MLMDKIHEKHLTIVVNDEHQRSLHESWCVTGSVNYWRDTRLLSPVLNVLQGLRNHSWLTIGDGSGNNAWRLLQAGFRDVLATDLDDNLLRQTKESGRINNYRIENAESLNFPDNSFDFILCKEALHHLTRPYAAIYEFFRVSRYGFVVIEPQDSWIDWPCLTDATTPHYEAVGNYVYQFSQREFEKIAFGFNIRGIATRNLVDVYLPGCEFANCVAGDSIWEDIYSRVEQANRSVLAGTAKPNYIQGIFFKDSVAPDLFDLLSQENPDWRFLRTDTNPHLHLHSKLYGTYTTNKNVVQTDKNDYLIPPEIKGDDFYRTIKLLASTEKLNNVLEIGSSSGDGSTEAFVTGFMQNQHKPSFFCMEISKARFDSLRNLYSAHNFVHCYNVSSVPVTTLPSEEDVKNFYTKTPTALNSYPLDLVLSWLREDIMQISTSGVDQNGIRLIKQERGISTFDLVLIDGSEFTGKAELDEIYGAHFILLDDINAYKNYENYQRLKIDLMYELYRENWQLRNGYAIFKRKTAEQ